MPLGSPAFLLTWLIFAAVLIGIGSILLRLARVRVWIFSAFWVGFIGAIGVLQVYHIFSPINSAAPLGLGVIGLGGMVFSFGPLWQDFRRLRIGSLPVVLSLFVFSQAVVWRAIGPCTDYDTGLYGATLVRWINTYPAVPGLANLHGRLGFNSTVYLCIAAIIQGIWEGAAYHTFNAMLYLTFAFLPAAAVWQFILNRPMTSRAWFDLLLCIPVLHWLFDFPFAGTNSDLAPALVAIIAARQLLWPCLTVDGKPNYFPVLALCAGLATLKLSMAPFAVGLSAIAIYLQGKSDTAVSWRLRGRALWMGISVSLLLIVPWLARGVILSGHPMYPSRIAALPVEWAVPATQAAKDAAWIRSWARQPQATLAQTAGWAWVRTWVYRRRWSLCNLWLPLALAVVGASGLLLIRKRDQGRSNDPPAKPQVDAGSGDRIDPISMWGLPLVATLALLFWFYNAPDPRFIWGIVWSLAGGLLAPILPRQRNITTVIGLVAILANVPAQDWSMANESFHSLAGWSIFDPIRSADCVPFRCEGGLTVQVPTGSDQAWDAPLPTTPMPNAKLRPRIAGNLGAGFQVERGQ